MIMGTVFSAYDIRGRLGDNISIESIWTVGKAFAEWLTEDGLVVVATTDGANESVANAFSEGLLLQGRNVLGVSVADEQAVNTAMTDHQAAGGVLISHDGIQNIEVIALYDARGALIGADSGLSEIDELVQSGNFLPAAKKGERVAS